MTGDKSLDSNIEEDRFLTDDDLPLKGMGFCLNARSDRSALAFGFKRAADLLVAEQLRIFRGGDYTVHAIVYLYRHHLELAFKEIWGQCAAFEIPWTRVLGLRTRAVSDSTSATIFRQLQQRDTHATLATLCKQILKGALSLSP